MKFQIRSALPVALSLLPLGATAQDFDEIAAQLRAELEILQQEVEAGEALPPLENSEAALRTQIEALTTSTGASPLSAARQTIETELRRRAQGWQIVSAPTPPAAPAAALAIAAPAQDVQDAPEADAPQIASTPAEQATAESPAAPEAGPGTDRVLSLPGARLLTEVGSEGEALPTFSILRVHGEVEQDGVTYLSVSHGSGAPEGLVERDRTEEWHSMLVMQYAPVGARERVVFFDEAAHLEELLASHWQGPEKIEALYKDVATGRNDPDKVVAIEPPTFVDSADRPYFMPIIDFKEANFDDDEQTPVFLLQLAAVTLDSETRDQSEALRDEAEIEGETLKDAKVGVVFAVDATLSMGPHIEAVKGFMHKVRGGIDSLPNADKFSFGLVGYRDSTAADTRIGYTTRTMLPLSSEGGADFEAALSQIEPSSVSTQDWREDAFAGLQDAIETTDWSGHDFRFVILVSDAGPRVIGDALARDARLGPRSIARMAEQRNISLIILHVLSEAGREDHARAKLAYSQAAETLDTAIPSYWTLDDSHRDSLARGFEGIADRMIDVFAGFGEGRAIGGDAPALFAFEDDPVLRDLESNGQPMRLDDARGAERIAAAVETELFRFQQEYLGRKQGGAAPDFYRAWVADRDLLAPSRESMRVKVLITRDQLSDLASRLGDIVARLENKQTGARSAFASIAATSGTTAYDPQMRIADFLPEYADDLPYGSQFMRMDSDTWAGLGSQQQEEILVTVRDRVRSYEAIFRSSDGWIDLPGRSGGEEVYPLDLDDLP